MLRYTLFQGNTGANWLRPSLADELFALGQPRPFPGNADKTRLSIRTWQCPCSEVPARATAQPTPRDLCKPSHNGVLTARRPGYRLRTQHRPPTSFAEPARRSSGATVHKHHALLD